MFFFVVLKIYIMNGKQLIKALSFLFKWFYHLNLILGFGIIGLTILNFIKPIKVLSAAYLGKFDVVFASATSFSKSPMNSSLLYLDRVSGNPPLLMNSPWHGFFVFLFVTIIVSITLVYNYQLWRLFHYLNNTATMETPFTDEVSHRLLFTSKFSFLIFAVGTILSSGKVLFMNTFYVNNMIVKPAFDNQLFNFLWIGIGLYVIAQVYKVGVDLKKEQDLTI
jgi:hypothetical protein